MLFKNDDVCRYCHSDIRLHMGRFTFSQLQFLISLAVKFARMVEGENSTEHKIALHWKSLFDDIDLKVENSRDNDDFVLSVLRAYTD